MRTAMEKQYVKQYVNEFSSLYWNNTKPVSKSRCLQHFRCELLLFQLYFGVLHSRTRRFYKVVIRFCLFAYLLFTCNTIFVFVYLLFSYHMFFVVHSSCLFVYCFLVTCFSLFILVVCLFIVFLSHVFRCSF